MTTAATIGCTSAARRRRGVDEVASMLQVKFRGGPADGTTYDYPALDSPLPQLYLIDYATGRTSAVYRRVSARPGPDGRWCYAVLDAAQTQPPPQPDPRRPPSPPAAPTPA
jgi:hypothetical protein